MSAATSRAEFLAVAAHEAVAEADEVVADVDGGADAVDAVQRLLAVAEGVVVLDVVVNEAGLVERLDGDGGALHGIGQFPAGVGERGRCALEGVVGGERDERPRALPAAGEEVVGDGLVLRKRVVGSPAGTGGLFARSEPGESVPAPRTSRSRPASGARSVFVFVAGGGVCRSIDSNTQSLSTDVFLQLLDSSGVAMHGMPASSTLSNAFSSTFRQATPTMASTWPDTMIFSTIGVPSDTSTL